MPLVFLFLLHQLRIVVIHDTESLISARCQLRTSCRHCLPNLHKNTVRCILFLSPPHFFLQMRKLRFEELKYISSTVFQMRDDGTQIPPGCPTPELSYTSTVPSQMRMPTSCSIWVTNQSMGKKAWVGRHLYAECQTGVSCCYLTSAVIIISLFIH